MWRGDEVLKRAGAGDNVGSVADEREYKDNRLPKKPKMNRYHSTSNTNLKPLISIVE